MYISSKFDNFDSFSEIVHSWDLDFIQLKSGKFHSELFQYVNTDFLLTSVNFNKSIHQRGTAPKNLWTFGVPKQQSSEFTWKNSLVQQDSIVIYAPSSELEAITHSNFSVYTFSFPERFIINVANYLGISDIHMMLSSIKNSVQKVAIPELNLLRSQISNFLLRLNTSEDTQLNNSDDMFSMEILSTILKLLETGKAQSKKTSIASRFKAIKKAEEFINDSMFNDNINIPKLLEITQVSERTLCYAFQDHYNMSPKAYLKSYRLNQLRKALYFSSRNNNTVESIAKKFGFLHMGQLAHDYQLLFNEKPLATLKR
ncbi:MAG: helix-turn-helix domain-containing protein [Gammaproteobacteria bacterium]|nr:helix-turn-helix domain-containing protein [Gammaproteobacteria bacterium]